MRAYPIILGLALILPVCGSLGEPFPAGEVAFRAVERAHFDALAVTTQRLDTPSAAPLVLRLNVVGDAADADLSRPFGWLREHANVIVVRDPHGAPLFLTRADLSATSGRATLGAAIPTGMAAEMRDPDVGACVVTHEILHFLGLRHDDDPLNIMYPHCGANQLARATLDEDQLSRLAQVRGITALTTGGAEHWATRTG